ncbi:Hypothetical protein RADP37_05541 [Roseomonas mucosa]|uniref:Uncharacterized protein n=1 Tax=Roseomonas mucosa TaxID=207340 RepID=A0A4Y1MTL4_9PROT|nr:Hypothetical protein RADP37_05541 [Roseomonas mucosa]
MAALFEAATIRPPVCSASWPAVAPSRRQGFAFPPDPPHPPGPCGYWTHFRWRSPMPDRAGEQWLSGSRHREPSEG